MKITLRIRQLLRINQNRFIDAWLIIDMIFFFQIKFEKKNRYLSQIKATIGWDLIQFTNSFKNKLELRLLLFHSKTLFIFVYLHSFYSQHKYIENFHVLETTKPLYAYYERNDSVE